MVEQRSATYTFLFTDIVGSTTLWEQTPESMDVALAQHDGLLRRAIAVHGGHVFKSLGDGLAAVFDDASGALGAAVSAQRALLAEHWSAGTPLRVRMGLQTGPARPRDGDYFSQTVNRVARLVSAADGGQILLSEATAAAVSPDLPPDVRLRALGEHYFRGMSRPENVFQVILPDLPDPSTDPEPAVEGAAATGTAVWPRLQPPGVERRTDAGGTMLAWHPTTSGTPSLSVLDTPFIPSYPFPVPERLIGRQPQLDALGTILERGRTSLQVVLVSAPAGTGKSTLVGALTRQARRDGTLCLVGGGYEEEGVVPLGPFREALADYLLTQPPVRVMAEMGSVVEDLAFVIPELRQHLAFADPSASSAAPDRGQLFGAISVCLRALTERQPVFVCLEDLHAVSSATLALIQALTHRLRRRPLVILGTYRSEQLTIGQPLADLVTVLRRQGATQIQLQPLSEDQTTTLAAALLDGQPSQQLSTSLYQSTEGNPLFIEQLLLALREDGRLDRRGSTWHQRGAGLGSIPTIVRDVIGGRLEHLTDDVRRTLEVAAVLGQTVDYQALLAAFGSGDEDTLLDHLDEAFNAQILQETPSGWAFVHPLFREVLYEGMSPPRRMRLHATVGEALERLAGPKADEQAAELARHFAFGGRSPAIREKALRYSLAAGRRANALSAYREALDHFTQACELSVEVGGGINSPAHMDALEGRGQAARSVGAWHDCIGSLRDFLELCEDPLRSARAHENIARALMQGGDTTASLAECEAGLASLGETDTRPEIVGVRLRIQYNVAWLHYLHGQYTRLSALAATMVEAAELLAQPTYLSMAHTIAGWSHMALDQLTPSEAHYRAAREAGERSGNKVQMAVAHVNFGIQLYRSAQFTAARPELERAIALFREAASDLRALNGIQTLGRVWLAEGDLTRAVEQEQFAWSIVSNTEDRWAAECHDLSGLIHAVRAEWTQAQACFSAALRIRERVGHRAGIVESLLGLGLVYERQGRWPRATSTYSRALEEARKMDPCPQTMAAEQQLGRLLLRQGDTRSAGTHIRAACVLAESMQQSMQCASTHLAAAELVLRDAPAEAVALAERALAAGGTVECQVEAHALALAAHVNLDQLEMAKPHVDDALALAYRLNTPYVLGLAHLARARYCVVAGIAGGEDAAKLAVEYFSSAGIPFEQSSALRTYADLLESRSEQVERAAAMRLEASRVAEVLSE